MEFILLIFGLTLIFSLILLFGVRYFNDTIEKLNAQMQAAFRSYQLHMAEEATAHREHLKELEVRLQSRGAVDAQRVIERRVQEENKIGGRGEPEGVDIFSDIFVPPEAIADAEIEVERPDGGKVKMPSSNRKKK